MSPGVRDRAVSAAYDAIAREYDRQLEHDAWMRRILWRRYGHVFRPGHHVLDVGCGTGTDAVFLARRGVRVTAIDVSAAMIAQAGTKVTHHGLTDRVQLVVLDIGELASLPAAEFDGIISSFAALNTLPTLTGFAADAARLLRSPGRLILHLLNRSSLWEWAGLVAHGRWADARRLGRRRERTFTIGGQPVQHYMLRADETYARYFAPRFRLCHACGLGITRPPSPIRHVPQGALPALSRLDALLGPYHPFIDWGRFVVLEMANDGACRPPSSRPETSP
jgi:ubiquinone/menaquinone biosynthesis C-methylase UbiE